MASDRKVVSPKLDNIPVEIATKICENLFDTKKKDLLNIGLANRFCHDVAQPLLFRSLWFDPNPGHTHENGYALALAEEVNDCRSTLEQHKAFEHVRWMVLGLKFSSDHWSTPSWPSHTASSANLDLDHVLQSHGILEATRLGAQDHVDTMKLDENCQPLIDLIHQLPGLTRLYWRCFGAGFPPRLLQALRKKKNCSLHIYTMRLPNLAGPEISPYDLELVQSPNLHSIGVSYDETDGYYPVVRPSYVLEAVLSTVRQKWLAPNLQEVRLFHQAVKTLVDEWGLAHIEDSPSVTYPPRPEWQGFSAGGQPTDGQRDKPEKKPLRLLEIGGLDPRNVLSQHDEVYLIKDRVLHADLMETWMTSTDFSDLEILRLGQMVSPSALGLLVKNCSFPYLHSLRFICDGRPGTAYYETLKGLLNGLHNLADLDIRQWDFGMLTLADALSPNLRNLYLENNPLRSQLPDQQEITRIIQRCQKLVELRMPIRRSRGNASEVNTYKTLGSLPELRRLWLDLDVSLPSRVTAGPGPLGQLDTAIEPHFDDFDQAYSIVPAPSEGLLGRVFTNWPYRNGHVKDLLLNAAVDRKLALAIFHAVSSGKRTGSAPLQEVHLEAMGWFLRTHGLGICTDAFMVLSMEFGLHTWHPRPFTVSRKLEQNHRHELKVHQLNLDYDFPDPEYSFNDLILTPAFRRIWPKKEGSEGWWKDWQSEPLAGYEEEWADSEQDWTVMEEAMPLSTSIWTSLVRARQGLETTPKDQERDRKELVEKLEKSYYESLAREGRDGTHGQALTISIVHIAGHLRGNGIPHPEIRKLERWFMRGEWAKEALGSTLSTFTASPELFGLLQTLGKEVHAALKTGESFNRNEGARSGLYQTSARAGQTLGGVEASLAERIAADLAEINVSAAMLAVSLKVGLGMDAV